MVQRRDGSLNLSLAGGGEESIAVIHSKIGKVSVCLPKHSVVAQCVYLYFLLHTRTHTHTHTHARARARH